VFARTGIEMKAWVGTSGYSYKEWKGSFYPEDLSNDGMLGYYAGQFDTVEVNNTFYRMPSSKMLEKWAGQVGDGFTFVLKASRRITHMGRLKEVGDSVDYLFDKAQKLGDKLGPVLFPLPPYLRLELERLERFLEMLPEGRRAVMEFRHVSWFDEKVYDLLRARNVAVCLGDGELKRGEVPFVATADWGYLRLRDVDYDDRRLGEWIERIRSRDWTEVFVFFKHEEDGAGPALARRFRDLFG
jgi:uncharacterized protein YecE (DUF72 family)